MLFTVEYLRHKISSSSLQPTDGKIKALRDVLIHQNVSQLKSSLGLFNCYGKFLPNLSTLLAPSTGYSRSKHLGRGAQLNKIPWMRAKESSDSILEHYNHSLPLVLTYDTSPYVIGTVLPHIRMDGLERPIAYDSR